MAGRRPRSKPLAPGLTRGDDGVVRCWWCGDDPTYQSYHDDEWGFPVADDRRLFEKMCLEGFQAGLSWLTILRKREAFRAVFRDFDPKAVARFTPRDVERALGNASIVRHRGKIESTVNNARRVITLAEESGSLAAWLWSFEPPRAARPRRLTQDAVMALTRTEQSTAMSAALKERGFTYVGPTTMYALMQAVGMVNDHLEGCATRSRVDDARRAFRSPARG